MFSIAASDLRILLEIVLNSMLPGSFYILRGKPLGDTYLCFSTNHSDSSKRLEFMSFTFS